MTGSSSSTSGTIPSTWRSGSSSFPFQPTSAASDPNSSSLCDAGPEEGLVRPVNYGFSFGAWFVFDPRTRQGSDGPLFPGSNLGSSAMADGHSNTLAVGGDPEGLPAAVCEYRSGPGPAVPAAPGQFAAWAGAAAFELGLNLNDNGGHTESGATGTCVTPGFTIPPPPPPATSVRFEPDCRVPRPLGWEDVLTSTLAKTDSRPGSTLQQQNPGSAAFKSGVFCGVI